MPRKTTVGVTAACQPRRFNEAAARCRGKLTATCTLLPVPSVLQ